MNKIAKRFAALVAAGTLFAGVALADIPSYYDVYNWTEEERTLVLNYIGRANYIHNVPETSEYIDFDSLGRAKPLYAGDRTAWMQGSDEKGWADIVFLFENVYSGEEQLKESGISDYYIKNNPNMKVFKLTVNLQSEDLERHESFSAYSFDVFSADGGKIKNAYGDVSNLSQSTEVYAGGNGSFYITVYDAPEGCQLRFSFGNDKYMWLSSAEKPTP